MQVLPVSHNHSSLTAPFPLGWGITVCTVEWRVQLLEKSLPPFRLFHYVWYQPLDYQGRIFSQQCNEMAGNTDWRQLQHFLVQMWRGGLCRHSQVSDWAVTEINKTILDKFFSCVVGNSAILNYFALSDNNYNKCCVQTTLRHFYPCWFLKLVIHCRKKV